MTDFRADVATTLELVREIHERVATAPLFPWRHRDGAEFGLLPGWQYHSPVLLTPGWANLTAEFRALDENRIELRFRLMGDAPSRPIVFELVSP